MNELRYDGEVAIVTGGGRGIGADYARMLAARGCRVLVNDLGAGVSGERIGESAADEVVSEIVRAGGVAVADRSDIVTDSSAVVERALSEFGRIDLLINNAGILSRNRFEDVSEAQLRQALDVHVVGSFLMTQAAWPHLVRAGSGRILLTSSGGVWGVPGSISYATAKGAIIGLLNTLALEAEEHGVRVCGLMPAAETRMNAEPGQKHTAELRSFMKEYFDPAHVAAFVVWLMHRDTMLSGDMFTVGGGRAARVVLSDARGAMNHDMTPESWRGLEEEVVSGEAAYAPSSATDSMLHRLPGMGIALERSGA